MNTDSSRSPLSLRPAKRRPGRERPTAVTLLLLTVLIFAMFTLSGCSETDSFDFVEEHDDQLDVLMQAAIEKDFEAAYLPFQTVMSRQEFETLWDDLIRITDGAGTYQVTNVHRHMDRVDSDEEPGYTYTSVYALKLDNEQRLRVQLDGRSNIEPPYGLSITDGTAFVNNNAWVDIVGVVLAALTLGLLILRIWMVVDCAKRDMKTAHQVLWILFILVDVWVTFYLGGPRVSFRFGVGLFSFMTATADLLKMIVGVKICMPVGAIIYACMRHKYPKRSKRQKMHQVENGIVLDAEDTCSDTDEQPKI